MDFIVAPCRPFPSLLAGVARCSILLVKSAPTSYPPPPPIGLISLRYSCSHQAPWPRSFILVNTRTVAPSPAEAEGGGRREVGEREIGKRGQMREEGEERSGEGEKGGEGGEKWEKERREERWGKMGVGTKE